jgi:hypothetical protein
MVDDANGLSNALPRCQRWNYNTVSRVVDRGIINIMSHLEYKLCTCTLLAVSDGGLKFNIRKALDFRGKGTWGGLTIQLRRDSDGSQEP